jgi:hypothetical protein
MRPKDSAKDFVLSEKSEHQELAMKHHNWQLKSQLDATYDQVPSIPSAESTKLLQSLKRNSEDFHKFNRDVLKLTTMVKPRTWLNIPIPLRDGLLLMIRAIEEL